MITMMQKKNNDIDYKNERVTNNILLVLVASIWGQHFIEKIQDKNIENSLDAMVHVKKQTNKKQQ